RSHIRLATLGLALIWIYDLNLYTVAYLGSATARVLAEWRGLAVAFTAPLFAFATREESGWRIRLSRAATFQSLSLLAICAYFDRRDGAPRLRSRLVSRADDLRARGHDGRGHGAASKRPRARVGQGQARQAFVRAPLRLSYRMAALHRDSRTRGCRRSAVD